MLAGVVLAGMRTVAAAVVVENAIAAVARVTLLGESLSRSGIPHMLTRLAIAPLVVHKAGMVASVAGVVAAAAVARPAM